MKQVFILALILTACAGAPGQPVSYAPAPTLPAQYALQDANATATAASRSIEATATEQAAYVATQVRQSVALAEVQTATAFPMAMAATQEFLNLQAATATEGAIYRAQGVQATATHEASMAARKEIDSNVWLIIGCLLFGLGGSIIVIVICRVILRVGYAIEAKVKPDTFRELKDDRGLPLGYAEYDPRLGRTVFYALPRGGKVVRQMEPPQSEEQIALEAWRQACKDVGQCASIAGSWGVNTLSTREGGLGCAPEDTITDARAIAAEIGAVIDFGSTRGYDWAPGWGIIDLETDIDAGRVFTLPRRSNGSPKMPANVDITKAQQSKAQQAQQDTVIKSPMRRSRKEPA